MCSRSNPRSLARRRGALALSAALFAACAGAPAADDATGALAEGGAMTLSSPAFSDGGALPDAFTCDGAGSAPPLEWSAPPAGTVELALLMTTLAPDGLKWNWVLARIPPDTRALDSAHMLGVAGLTSDGPDLAYSPPCSAGPGPKTYTFTLYALSEHPALPASPREMTGAVLTDAIAGVIVSRADLVVTHTR